MRERAESEPLRGIYRETFDALARMREQNGISPTLRELAIVLRVSSTNAVRQRLDILQRRGYIIRLKRIARGIVLVNRP